MQLKQKQLIEMCLRVNAFLAAYPPPASPGYTAQKATLDDIVAKLGEHSTDQVAGRRMSRAETQRQKALRRTLREEHLAPIAQIARAMLSDKPGIEKALRLPSASLSSLGLAAEADGMRAAAAQFADTFIQCGRADDFLAQLERAANEVRASVVGVATNTGQQIGASHGLKGEIKRARKAVDVIETIVRAAFGSKPEVMARWFAAKRIRAVPFAGVMGGQSAKVTEDPADVAPPSASSVEPAAA